MPNTQVTGYAGFNDENIPMLLFANVGDTHYQADYDITTGAFSVTIPTVKLLDSKYVGFQLVNNEYCISDEVFYDIDWVYDSNVYLKEYNND